MTTVQKGFVDVPHGQVHFRYGGRGPVVVILHDSPRSSVPHVSDIEWLGENFTVIALDTPGHGNSSPLPQPTPEIADFADALATTLTALGIERCALYGVRTGAQIALQFAITHPDRASPTILDGLPLPRRPASTQYVQRHLQPIEPEADGAHLVRLWSRVLDVHRYDPWFEKFASTRIACALPDDLDLHEYATDLMMSGPHGSAASGAALRHDSQPTISRLRSSTVFLCREDDLACGYLEALPQPLPSGCRIERLGPQLQIWRTRMLEILRRSDLPATRWRPPKLGSRVGGERQRYVDLVHGQIRVRHRGEGAGVPMLVLHDVPGGSCALRPLTELLSDARHTIAPDLPGLGDSHPLPYPSLGSYVTALVELLEALECGPVDVVAEGLGTCFAAALAARHPGLVRRLALDGLPMIRSKQRRFFARNYCPPLVPDRHGSHLVRTWHQLRDAESTWPWFHRSAAAARRHDPDLDAARRQAVLVELMKQPPSYGDAARAALDSAVRDILRGVNQPALLFDAAGDVRYEGTRRASARLADARLVPRPHEIAERVTVLRDFFD